MEAVFLSNFYNHHQMPLSRSFYQMLGDHYLFVETAPMDAERRQMGYQEFEEPFVCQFGDCPKACMDRISQADVVIFGSAPEKLIRERLKKGKLVFQYSERIYKIPPKWYEMPARAAKYYLNRGDSRIVICSAPAPLPHKITTGPKHTRTECIDGAISRRRNITGLRSLRVGADTSEYYRSYMEVSRMSWQEVFLPIVLKYYYGVDGIRDMLCSKNAHKFWE